MKLRFKVLFLVAVLLTAGLAYAQEQKRFGAHVPPELKAAKVASPIKILPEFNAVYLGYVYEPWGVGVTASGNQAYVNSPYDYEIWKYDTSSTNIEQNKAGFTSMSLLFETDTMPGANYYGQDLGLYWGDNEGNVFHHVLDTPIQKTLAAVGGGWDDYPNITAVTVDPASASVYFFDAYTSNLYRVPNYDGHTPKLIAHLPFNEVFGLAIKGNLIYISDAHNDRIYRMQKNGGKLNLFVSGLNGPCGLAFDKNGNLYIANYNEGAIARIKRNTKKIEWIADGFEAPFFIAVDGKGNVYFTDFDDDALWMLTRKDVPAVIQ
jgi:hypothetical protein